MLALAAPRRRERLAAAALLVGWGMALLMAGARPAFALFTGTSASPANTLGTQVSFWFDATGTGTAICSGTNAALACAYGNRGRPVTVTATFSLTNKNVTATEFRLNLIDGTGPDPISDYVTATFASTGDDTKLLGAGATDTVQVLLETTTGTPVGAYTGTLEVEDTTTGNLVTIPLSVTVQ